MFIANSVAGITGGQDNPPSPGVSGGYVLPMSTMLRMRGVHFDGGTPAGGAPAPAPAPAPAGGTPAPEKKKGNFQLALEAVRNERQREVESLTGERDTLKAELDALKAKGGQKDEAYAETIRKPLLDQLEGFKTKELSRATKLKRAEAAKEVKGLAVEGAEGDVIDAIMGELALNDDDAVEVVEIVDGKPRRRYGAEGPMTVRDRAMEVLKAKPWLAAPSVRSGLGLKDVPRGSGPSASVESLKQEIAEAEGKRDFVKAGRLKTALLEAQRNAKK